MFGGPSPNQLDDNFLKKTKNKKTLMLFLRFSSFVYVR